MYYLPLIFSLGFLKIFYLLVILLFSLYLLYKRDPRDVFFVSLFSLIFFFSLFSISAPSREQIQILPPILIVLIARMISNKKTKIMLAIFVFCYLIMLYRYFNQYTGDEYGYKALIKFFNETGQKKFIVNYDRTRFILYYFLDEGIWEPYEDNPVLIVNYEEGKTGLESVEGCLDYAKKYPDFWCVLIGDKYTKNMIDKVEKDFERKEIFMSSDGKEILYYVLGVKK